MYEVNLHDRIAAIPAARWDALCAEGYPFLRHAFLEALEASASVGADTGWQPLHLELTSAGQTRLVMPLYLKSHSLGEYVFDWAWADAYHRHGLDYYPKLVNAIPFTPASGPRYGTNLPEAEVQRLLPALLDQVMNRLGASSWHCLFPPAPPPEAAAALITRLGCQYHWFNRGYRDFEDFLAAFTARKRKAVRRERRKVAEQGVQLQRLTGEQITRTALAHCYRFYQSTYRKRGRRGYLSEDFFVRLWRQMPERLLLVMAEQAAQPVAAAFYLIGDDCLYGRYWGCDAEFDSLHFEACYYQGIEFCIERGLSRFDPGAQGEHKIQRGFEPIRTWSVHHIADPRFAHAIAGFVAEERQWMEQQIEQWRSWLPFRQPAR